MSKLRKSPEARMKAARLYPEIISNMASRRTPAKFSWHDAASPSFPDLETGQQGIKRVRDCCSRNSSSCSLHRSFPRVAAPSGCTLTSSTLFMPSISPPDLPSARLSRHRRDRLASSAAAFAIDAQALAPDWDSDVTSRVAVSSSRVLLARLCSRPSSHSSVAHRSLQCLERHFAERN